MRILKKLLVVFGVLFVLAIAINYGLAWYIKKKLPSIIKAETNFPYNLDYKDLDVNLLGGSFTMVDAVLVPKENKEAATKNGVFAKVGTISVRGIQLWQLYRYSRIRADEVLIEKPDVTIYHTKRKYTVQDDVERPFHQVVHTGRLRIVGGTFKMLDSLSHPKLRASNIAFTLTNIKVDSMIVKENIPVRYRDYNFSCDSLYYNAGFSYNIEAGSLRATDTSLAANNFRLVPKQTRRQFSNMVPEERDQFNIKADSILVSHAEWGFVHDTLYVHTPRMVLDKVYANIYRSKEPKDDPRRKKLYSELLRSINFDLKVDKLLLKNTTVEYEEQINFSKPPAHVLFSKMYATISNIYSPIGKQKLPTTTIDAQCLFMKSAPLKVNWSFNTPDRSDTFTITGHLQNIRSEEINPITKPLMNATTSGVLKDVRFTFTGNRERGGGTFAIEYDDLKVSLYKKDGKKKNKLLSAVGNLLVKSDSDDRLNKTNVQVPRNKDKSVFNFLVKFVQQGLKQTVLPKIAGGD